MIYYWVVNKNIIYILFDYAKHEDGDLTKEQISMLKKFVEKEFGNK